MFILLANSDGHFRDCLDIRIWERSFLPPKIIPLRKEVLDSMQPVASIHIPSSRSPRAVESFMVVTIPIYRVSGFNTLLNCIYNVNVIYSLLISIAYRFLMTDMYHMLFCIQFDM